MAIGGMNPPPPGNLVREATALLEGASAQPVRGSKKVRNQILEITKGRCLFQSWGNAPSIEFVGFVTRVARMNVEVFRWTGDARCETATWRTKDHHLSLYLPLRGKFEAKQGVDWIEVPVGSGLIVTGSGETRRRWHGASYLLNIMIDREALDQRLMRGVTQTNTIMSLPPIGLMNLRNCSTLSDFIGLILSDLNSAAPTFRDPEAGYEAERLLLQLLVMALRGINNERPVRDRHVIVPAYVRAAERFMRSQYSQHITLQNIAAACDVSVRTLQYSFQKYRRTTPIEFLRDLRLTFARSRLLFDSSASISTVANAVGYRSHSQFARDYKTAFGESPRVTRSEPSPSN